MKDFELKYIAWIKREIKEAETKLKTLNEWLKMMQNENT